MANSAVLDGLLSELARAEVAALAAEREWERAWAEYDVAARKLAAIRDATEAYLGKSPYASDVEWPKATNTILHGKHPGRLRFVHRAIGDAVLDVLKDKGEYMTLEEIVAGLLAGGSRDATARAVNASLMRLAGVEKDEEEKRYRYKEPETDPDDLPFE